MLAEQPEKYEKTESSSESWNPISLAFRRISHPTCSSLCEVRQLRKPNTEIAARHGSAAIEYERKAKLVGGVGTGLLTSRRSKNLQQTAGICRPLVVMTSCLLFSFHPGNLSP